MHYNGREIERTPADILKASGAWEVVREALIVVQDITIELYFL